MDYAYIKSPRGGAYLVGSALTPQPGNPAGRPMLRAQQIFATENQPINGNDLVVLVQVEDNDEPTVWVFKVPPPQDPILLDETSF